MGYSLFLAKRQRLKASVLHRTFSDSAGKNVTGDRSVYDRSLHVGDKGMETYTTVFHKGSLKAGKAKRKNVTEIKFNCTVYIAVERQN